MGHDVALHARLPESLDVAGDAVDGVGALRFRGEKMANVIGHLHQVLDAHPVGETA
jgi:hypothetical protein